MDNNISRVLSAVVDDRHSVLALRIGSAFLVVQALGNGRFLIGDNRSERIVDGHGALNLLKTADMIRLSSPGSLAEFEYQRLPHGSSVQKRTTNTWQNADGSGATTTYSSLAVTSNGGLGRNIRRTWPEY